VQDILWTDDLASYEKISESKDCKTKVELNESEHQKAARINALVLSYRDAATGQDVETVVVLDPTKVGHPHPAAAAARARALLLSNQPH
jgi:hypothetical protein